MAPLRLNVKSSKADSKIEVTVEETDTVKALKEKLADKAETPADRQRLIYSGRVLKDDDTVGSYKIQDGHTVHLVRGALPPGSASSAAPASTPMSTTAAPTSSCPVPAAGAPGAAPTPAFGAGNMFTPPAGMGGFDELAGMGRLGRMRGLGGTGGLGDMGGIGGLGNMGGRVGGGMGGFDLSTLAQSPAYLQYISMLMSNPDALEAVMSTDPRFAAMFTPEMRAYVRSPQVRQMMSDPNMLQMILQMTAGGLMGGGFGGGMGGPGGWGGMGGMGSTGQGAPVATATTSTANPPPAAAPSPTASSQLGAGAPAPAPAPQQLPQPQPSMAAQMVAQILAGGGGGFGAPGLFGTPVAPAAPGFFGAPVAPVAPQQPPEERFAAQLQQLNDMGFWDAQSNVRALTATDGNVNAAVEWLLSHQ